MIDNYYKIKQSAPEFFANRHVDSKEIQTTLDNLDYVALPITPDNCHLVFHRLSNYDPKVFNFDSASKALFMLLGKLNTNYLKVMKKQNLISLLRY